MCGYVGVISKKNINLKNLKLSNDYLTCRGPDELKIFDNSNIKINGNYLGFIFNRLSILDLSENGSQPMHSKLYNSTILFNGEIFNFLELKKEIQKKTNHYFTSQSDTEVLFAGLNLFGINFINKLRGQFAITFIDYKSNCAYLVRDRLGQKPLFYSISEKNFVFGSNLKSIYENIDEKKN